MCGQAEEEQKEGSPTRPGNIPNPVLTDREPDERGQCSSHVFPLSALKFRCFNVGTVQVLPQIFFESLGGEEDGAGHVDSTRSLDAA